MTRRKTLWIGALTLAALVGAYLAADALIESDEERVEVIIADSTGRISAPRMDGARRRWVDLSRQPFEISAFGESLLYRAGEDDALELRAREAVRTLSRDELRAVTSGVSVEGDEAVVSIRLLGREQGMAQVRWTLRKHGDQWLVARLSIQR